MPIHKYQPFPPIHLPDRKWPGRTIKKAPIWCSVDLRDGNQALIKPMNARRKRRFFDTLVKMGFKEIEVGFPAASKIDFEFIRTLIEDDLIPDDVTIQVLTQAREHIIEKTFESLRGVGKAIVHLYNSTSSLQRRVVFGLDRAGVVSIATQSTQVCRALADAMPDSDIRFEYSPESFTGTELDFAKEICEAVMEVWRPSPEKKMILNLPATVEMATPNVFADQIEWFARNVTGRDRYILSVHPHNDCGTAVAAAELAVMAAADRVEGTLFGNGERTGNVDVVTLALNLFSQGVDPELDISNINEIREVAESCNQIPVHVRHPYVGDLVYTAFSGSHQDAIKKGMAALRTSNSQLWEVPYLPIDPKDVGRSYESIVRINSQSGKGGVAYVLHTDYGLDLPYDLQVEFSRIVQDAADTEECEIAPEMIWRLFEQTYIRDPGTANPGALKYLDHESRIDRLDSAKRAITARVEVAGKEVRITGTGYGPIEALVNALKNEFDLALRVEDFVEHAVQSGTDATACAYLNARTAEGKHYWGVGLHRNITTASLLALISAANQALARR